MINNLYVTIICLFTYSSPVPTYNWQYQGQDVKSRYPGSDELNFEFFQFLGNKMELRIRRITRYSGGTFKCFASNSMGTVWSIGQLAVSCRFFFGARNYLGFQNKQSSCGVTVITTTNRILCETS